MFDVIMATIGEGLLALSVSILFNVALFAENAEMICYHVEHPMTPEIANIVQR